MGRKVRIGTRGSKLALWQANWVKERIEKQSPGIKTEIVKIKTTGDKILDVALAKVGGKGLFVKEIEEALLDHRIDVAVHSTKDVPTKLADHLHIAAITEREDPRDVMISNRWKHFNDP
jgi:hydroxymethylbilane synthase